MAIWMEVRCDLNRSADCWDSRNRMVEQGGWSRRHVLDRARRLGWKFDRSGAAACPACQQPAQEQPA